MEHVQHIIILVNVEHISTAKSNYPSIVNFPIAICDLVCECGHRVVMQRKLGRQSESII